MFVSKFILDPWAWAAANLADAAGGAPAGDPPPADPPAASPPPADPPATPPAAYRPDGLPDTFAGGSERETIDKLWQHVAGLPKAPETADAYTLADDLMAKVAKGADDPVLQISREVAHGLGMNQAQFEGFVGGLFTKMAEAGLYEPPRAAEDIANEQFLELGGTVGDPADRRTKGMERVTALSGQIDALATREVITKAEAETLKDDVLTTAGSVKAFEKLLKAIGGEHGVVPGGGGGGQLTPQQEREAALAKMFPSHAPKASAA